MLEDDDEHLTTDGMPMQRAPIIRLIFASPKDKERFLDFLSSVAVSFGLDIGASDEKPLIECDDLSVEFEDSKH